MVGAPVASVLTWLAPPLVNSAVIGPGSVSLLNGEGDSSGMPGLWRVSTDS